MYLRSLLLSGGVDSNHQKPSKTHQKSRLRIHTESYPGCEGQSGAAWPAVVCKAIKKRAASQMCPGLEEQSEGCAAGVGSLSLDVWYVMKPIDGPVLDYGSWRQLGMAPGSRRGALGEL